MLSTKMKIAFARTVYRGLTAVRTPLGISMTPEIARRGIRWKLDLREGIDLAIYLFGAFENSTVYAYRRLLRQGDTVLDIGANIGAHTLHLAKCVGVDGRVHAFEPTAYAFSKLQSNIALNPKLADRITACQAMLVATMDATTTSAIYSSWPLTQMDKLHPIHLGRMMGTEGATAITLDHYFEHQRINRLDLVKIDVDGNECAVFRGGLATLSRFRPLIVMELAPYALTEAGSSLEELLEILTNLGYRLSKLDGRSQIGTHPDKIRRQVPTGGSINIIASTSQRAVNTLQ